MSKVAPPNLALNHLSLKAPKSFCLNFIHFTTYLLLYRDNEQNNIYKQTLSRFFTKLNFNTHISLKCEMIQRAIELRHLAHFSLELTYFIYFP